MRLYFVLYPIRNSYQEINMHEDTKINKYLFLSQSDNVNSTSESKLK